MSFSRAKKPPQLPDKTEPDKTELDKTELDKAGPDKTGLDTAGLDTAGLDTAGLDETRLHEYALRLLGQQMRSVADLRRKLMARVEPGETGAAKVQAVLGRLREYGLVDDAAFAENFVQMRQQNQKHGPRRLRNDLALKGIDRELAARTVEERFAEVDEVELARQHLERKRVRKPENEKETARVMRRLAAAGFSARAIHAVLRDWRLPEEARVSQEALDGLDEMEGHEE